MPLSRCLGISERFSKDFVINSNGLYHKVIENNEDFAVYILGERYYNSPIECQLAPFCYNVSLNEILTGRAGLRRSSCDNFPQKSSFRELFVYSGGCPMSKCFRNQSLNIGGVLCELLAFGLPFWRRCSALTGKTPRAFPNGGQFVQSIGQNPRGIFSPSE